MSRCDRRAAACRRRFAAVTVVLAALIAGCATVAPPPAPPAASGTPAIEREWAGRFAVRVESTGAEGRQDAAAGRFVLTSRPARGGRELALELTSPFGQTVAEGSRGADGRATLTLSDGRRIEAGSLDAVIEQALGWPLPVERLTEWLDDRFEQVTARDADGRPSAAIDSGWRIEREPRRWTLLRPHPQGRLVVVLLLDR